MPKTAETAVRGDAVSEAQPADWAKRFEKMSIWNYVSVHVMIRITTDIWTLCLDMVQRGLLPMTQSYCDLLHTGIRQSVGILLSSAF